MKIKSGHIAFIVGAAIATYCAGTKPSNRVTAFWDEYFSGGVGTVDSNNVCKVDFTWRARSGLPPTSRAYLSAIRIDAGGDAPTARPLFDVTNVLMQAEAVSVTMPHPATNYFYYFECDYVPVPPVATNGVYKIHCAGTPSRAVPIGVTVTNQLERTTP